MGFEDFFEQGHKRHKHGHDNHYGHDNEHRYEHDRHHSSHSYNKHNDVAQVLFKKLQDNPKLKGMLIFAAIFIIIVVIILIIILFPLLLKLFNYFTENGVQGIINAVWKGVK